MKKEIVIVGGGTAGWLTALYANKIYGKSASITLIESEELGILGAGEGTLPIFVSTLFQLKIDLNDFIKKTNSTFKLGISFENWNGDGKKYFHAFGSIPYVSSPFDFNNLNSVSVGNEYIGYLLKNNLSLDDCILSNVLLKNNKSPFLKNDNNQISNYYAIHFDASLVAKYFRKIAEKRGIKRIDSQVKDFKLDDSNNVKKIILKNGEKINCDFVFDCSGFRRLIIGGLYKSKWKSYQKHLTVNSAISFFLPQKDEQLKPYTRAIAMKHGWLWMIPLQNRWGCGYIFDSNYIDEGIAINEVQEFLGQTILPQRSFKFDAGRFEKVWINNCISIGLSSGFTEPIEATSIGLAITQLDMLDKNILESCDEKNIDLYNKRFGNMNDNILNFLQFHYFTKRKDTDFWKYYIEKSPKLPELEKLLNIFSQRVPIENDFTNSDFTFFTWHSYIYVGIGLGYFNKQLFIDSFEKFAERERMEIHHKKNLQIIDDVLKNSYSLSEYLKKDYFLW